MTTRRRSALGQVGGGIHLGLLVTMVTDPTAGLDGKGSPEMPLPITKNRCSFHGHPALNS
jgi:hypothetical protein